MLLQTIAVMRWMARLCAPAVLTAAVGLWALSGYREARQGAGTRGVEVRLSSPESEWLNAESGRVTLRLQCESNAIEEAGRSVVIVHRAVPTYER